jgi:hypothetical protein
MQLTCHDALSDKPFSFRVCCQGQLYSWGGGDHGQLGLGDDLNRLHPCLVQIPASHHASSSDNRNLVRAQRVVGVCCGSYMSAAVTEEDLLYTWGLGDDGQLGQGDEVLGCNLPGLVAGLPPVSLASAGDAHMACVRSSEACLACLVLLASIVLLALSCLRCLSLLLVTSLLPCLLPSFPSPAVFISVSRSLTWVQI